MPRRRSRGEAEIEARLQTLDPSTPRYQVLAAARDFKAAWVALGERLTEVREKGVYRDWGYANFEAYCRRELRIKRDTANKLTRSFSFLRDHEPDALEANSQRERELPPLDVVDLLSRARERTKVSDDQLQQIQQEVFAPESSPPTRNQVLKRFREVDPDAFRAAPRAKSGGDGDLRKALLLAERLLSLMETQQGISSQSISHVRAVVAELRDRFESTRQMTA